MSKFEFEVPEELKDKTLWGNRLESWIERFFPRLSKWSHDNDCGCSWRRDKLNDLHLWFRELNDEIYGDFRN